MYTKITLLFVGVIIRKACLQQVEFSEQKLLMIKHLLNEWISVNSSAVNSTDLFIIFFIYFSKYRWPPKKIHAFRHMLLYKTMIWWCSHTIVIAEEESGNRLSYSCISFFGKHHGEYKNLNNSLWLPFQALVWTGKSHMKIRQYFCYVLVLTDPLASAFWVVALMDSVSVVGSYPGSGRNCPRLRWDPWARHRTPTAPRAPQCRLPTVPSVCTWMDLNAENTFHCWLYSV